LQKQGYYFSEKLSVTPFTLWFSPFERVLTPDSYELQIINGKMKKRIFLSAILLSVTAYIVAQGNWI